MICTDCGHDNPDGSIFCEECGASFVANCPSCQKENTKGAKFCRFCGKDIPALPDAPTQSAPEADADTGPPETDTNLPPHIVADLKKRSEEKQPQPTASDELTQPAPKADAASAQSETVTNLPPHIAADLKKRSNEKQLQSRNKKPEQLSSFCDKCGSSIPSGGIFCANCGQAQGAIPKYDDNQRTWLSGSDFNRYSFFYLHHLRYLFLCHSGRINRRRHFLGGLLLLVFCAVYFSIGAYICAQLGLIGLVSTYVVVIPSFGLLIYGDWMLCVKRAHDTDRSWPWLFVPFLYLILYFQSGTYGPNKYGPDPRK